MIESLNNDKIKEYSKLNEKKYRNINKLFLAPGKHLVEEALKKGIVKEIFLLDGNTDQYDVKNTYVSVNVMKKLVNLDNPPKEVAVCYIKDNNQIIGNVVMLDDVADPGNLGTIIRSAVAFNYNTIILSNNCVDIYNPKVIRASEGMLFNVNIVIGDLVENIKKLKDDDYSIYSTDVVNGVSPCKDIYKHAIIIGSEAKGVKDEIKQLANKNFKINMNPLCESLNAGVSASILMYIIGGK